MSKNIGVDLKECSIILIENYPCKDKPELLRKEREYFDKYKKECKEVFLNKYRPIVTEEERKEYKKDYQIKNKEKIKEYREKTKEVKKVKVKEWEEKNKDKIKENKKEYYGNNKEEISKKRKERYEKNKEEINKKEREKPIPKITCECGCTINKKNTKRHKKTKKHIKLMESLQ